MAGFLDAKASSNVNVTGFGENALKGILDAIQKNHSAIEKISSSIDAGNKKAEQNHEDDLVRSENSERQSRAAYSAVHDEIDKGLSILDSLKNIVRDALNKFVDISKEMAMKSIRAYDDNTKAMRQNFLTTAQIKDNLIKGDKAKLVLSEMGIKVSSDETKNIVAQLANAGADTSNLNKEQIAAITMMNKVLGTDIKTALTIAKTSSDPTAIIKMAVNATDTVGREATTKLLESVNETWFVQYARQQGGTENALKQLQEAAKKLDSSLGDYGLSADSQKNLLSGLAKITSGQLEKVQEEEVKNLLAISGDAMKSPEKLMEGIQNLITRNDITAADKLKKIRVLEKIPGMDENFMNSLKNAITAQEKGNYKEKSIRDYDTNKESINQAQQGGRVGGFINDALTRFNVFTSKFIDGGVFGGISAELNEWMGDSVETGDIVKHGFTMVGKLISKLIEKVSGGFGNFGGGIMGNLQSSAGGMLVRKIVTSPGFLAAAAVAASGFVAYKAISDEAEKQSSVSDVKEEIDKNKQSILDKTAELERAKKYGTESDVAALSAEIAKLKANIPTLESKLHEAELNSRSNSAKTADEYAKNVHKDLVAKQNEATKWESYYLKAKAAGDKESMEAYATKMEAANKSIEEINANKQALREYKDTAMAALLDPLNLSADSMVKLNKYKDLIYSIGLGALGPIGNIVNNIRLVATNWDKVTAKIGSTIGSIIPAAQDVADTLNRGVSRAKDLKATISKGVDNFKTKVSNVINPFKDFFKLEWLPQSIKDFIFGGGKEAASRNSGGIMGTVDTVKRGASVVTEAVKNAFMGLFDLKKDGGVVTSATPAVVGEAGKEVIFPLTRPDQIRNVFSQLSNNEKFLLLKELLKSNKSFSTASLSNILYNILTNKDKFSKQSTTTSKISNSTSSGTSNRELVSGDVAQTDLTRKIIEGAAVQKGHTYSEMVCNQLVEAALRYAGFQLPTRGVVTKHFNNDKMRLVLNDPINGISPTDPALVPGMIMFSHPFTQEEADQLNAQKGGKRKAGDPGHMGIYAGNGLWWNSTSSKSTYDYSSGEKVKFTESGVALTKPMTTGTYKLYAAGYYDGMFDSSVTGKLPTADKKSTVLERATEQTKQLLNKVGSNSQPSVKQAGLLSTNEIMSILNEAGIKNAPVMSSYIEQAKKLLANGSDKENIITLLTEIARYLRSMSVNKNTAVPVSRPPAAAYGVSGAR